jgi:hypothetical protein
MIGGGLASVHYRRLGLTLSHYDARGHLVVARRIFDSLTPGWQQIGAVWLPLPHLLNALPVQVDAWYRSGASAVAISIVSYAIAVGSIAWIVLMLTDSALAALAGASVFAFNPNVLYLQATPMTEPLLLGLTTLGVALLLEWCGGRDAGLESRRVSTATVGVVLALACLTRYEAWPVTTVALVAAAWVRWRRGESASTAVRRVALVGAYPAAAILAFAVFSRVVIGVWLVASGFFVPENKALGSPLLAASEIGWGVQMLSSSTLTYVGAAGAAVLVVLGLVRARWAGGLVVLALSATAAVPWAAFLDGHPFRIRYMVPLIAFQGAAAGIAVGLLPRARVLAALALLAVVGYELRPLDRSAPMVVEAQWDRPNVPARAAVTACLGPPSGETIMASMGSLGHYMQEAAGYGFRISDFLHEGNGDIWLAALANGPRTYAEWVLIEEKAEGGDMLAVRAREQPHFLDGYSRICEGAGLALYRRVDALAAGSRP